MCVVIDVESQLLNVRALLPVFDLYHSPKVFNVYFVLVEYIPIVSNCYIHS